jgi:hypothetical protein
MYASGFEVYFALDLQVKPKQLRHLQGKGRARLLHSATLFQYEPVDGTTKLRRAAA